MAGAAALVSGQPARSAADLLIAVTICMAWRRCALSPQNWLLLFTAHSPALPIMILLNIVARFQDRHGPLRAALLTTGFFWLFHVSSFYVDTRSSATRALVLALFLLPQLGSRVIAGWLYNGAGSSVLMPDCSIPCTTPS